MYYMQYVVHTTGMYYMQYVVRIGGIYYIPLYQKIVYDHVPCNAV